MDPDLSIMSWLILGCVLIELWVAIAAMRSRITNCRPSVGQFIGRKITQQPGLSVDAALEDYLKTTDLLIQVDPDEPKRISVARTKVVLLEEFLTDTGTKDRGPIVALKASYQALVREWDHAGGEVREALVVAGMNLGKATRA